MARIATEQKAQPEISPKLAAKIRPLLAEFSELRDRILDAQADQDRIKVRIEEAFVKAGQFAELQEGVNIDGFPLKHISGTQKRLDKKFMVSQGWVTLAQLAEATKEVPKKAYLMVRVPGEKDNKGEDE